MGVFDVRHRTATPGERLSPGWRLASARHAAPVVAALLIAAALAGALVSLAMPSSPSYDPFAWLVWGRELTTPGQTFAVAGGPSWKPLPVLFTAPFALVGGSDAPALWLLVARAGFLLALAGGWALAARLAGRWAAALTVGALVLLGGLPSLALRGASEPLMLACVLWAIERHLAGARRTAFALGVAATLVRPEAFAFVLVYAAWCWRGARPRERWLLAGGIVLAPLLWLGPPALLGDALSPSHYAVAYQGATGGNPGWTALRRGLGLAVAPVWIFAALAVALRPRDRVVWVLAAGAVAWLALVAVMTMAGYPGLARFMLPAAVVACVLAGVGAVELARRLLPTRPPLGAAAVGVALATLLVVWAGPVATLGGQVREATRLGSMHEQLARAVAAAGGPAAIRACGTIATNGSAQTALAWQLGVPLARVAHRLATAGIAIVGPHSPELGATPAVPLRGARHRVVARAGVWRVVVVTGPAAPMPSGCRFAHA